MRVLLLTDSLSLPRSEGNEVVNYEDTYPALLRKKFSNSLIIDSAIGGATILDLYKQVFYYKNCQPDLVILHCGIVDCAPRAWRSFGRKLISATGLKLKGVTRFLRKYRGLKLTSPSKFDHLSGCIKNEFKSTPVYAVGILPASSEYEIQVPGITKNINLYNSILEKKFNFIDNSDFPLTAIMPDFHHLNNEGHRIIFEKISKIIASNEK